MLVTDCAVDAAVQPSLWMAISGKQDVDAGWVHLAYAGLLTVIESARCRTEGDDRRQRRRPTQPRHRRGVSGALWLASVPSPLLLCRWVSSFNGRGRPNLRHVA